MNKIKFRVWQKEVKFDYGNNLITTYPVCWEEGVYIGQDGKLYECDYELITRNPDNYIVQQFTGLSDKNNKEIFDGDIIKFVTKVELGDSETHTGEVWFDTEYGVWTFGKWWCDNTPQKYVEGKWEIVGEKSGYWGGYTMLDTNLCEKTIEVLGNIFENKELLK